MLEILLLIVATKSLAKRAAAKGHSKMWGGLAPLLWIVGEVVGLIIGYALGLDMGAYLVALLSAAIGAATAFIIVGNLSPRQESEAVSPDLGGVGNFHADNPYSPPGTYKPSANA